MIIRLRSEEAAGVCRIRAEGEIRSVVEPRDLRYIEEILGPRCYRRKILLDLEDAPHIDSSGVSWLVNFHKSSQTAGGMLVLHSAPPAVMAVLKLLGMHQYFNLVADERAALAWPWEENHERRRTDRTSGRSPCPRQTLAAARRTRNRARSGRIEQARVTSTPLTSPGCGPTRPSPRWSTTPHGWAQATCSSRSTTTTLRSRSGTWGSSAC